MNVVTKHTLVSMPVVVWTRKEAMSAMMEHL